MKKVLTTFAFMIALAPMSSIAESTFSFPKAAPELSITFPEGWKTDIASEDQTLAVVSPDEEVEMYLWALPKPSDPKKMLEQLEETANEVADDIHKYVDGFKVEGSKKGSVNGFKAAMFEGTGKLKEDGEEVNVEVHYLSPDDKRVFVLMYWGSEEGETANKEALAKITSSLKKHS